MSKWKLSWQYVFNTELKHHGFISLAAKVAIQNGYQYMSWNGMIYKINKDSGGLEEVGLVKDIM